MESRSDEGDTPPYETLESDYSTDSEELVIDSNPPSPTPATAPAPATTPAPATAPAPAPAPAPIQQNFVMAIVMFMLPGINLPIMLPIFAPATMISGNEASATTASSAAASATTASSAAASALPTGKKDLVMKATRIKKDNKNQRDISVIYKNELCGLFNLLGLPLPENYEKMRSPTFMDVLNDISKEYLQENNTKVTILKELYSLIKLFLDEFQSKEELSLNTELAKELQLLEDSGKKDQRSDKNLNSAYRCKHNRIQYNFYLIELAFIYLLHGKSIVTIDKQALIDHITPVVSYLSHKHYGNSPTLSSLVKKIRCAYQV